MLPLWLDYFSTVFSEVTFGSFWRYISFYMANNRETVLLFVLLVTLHAMEDSLTPSHLLFSPNRHRALGPRIYLWNNHRHITGWPQWPFRHNPKIVEICLFANIFQVLARAGFSSRENYLGHFTGNTPGVYRHTLAAITHRSPSFQQEMSMFLLFWDT